MSRQRRHREPSMLPPRLRDWEKGTPQVGAFLRTENGGVLQMVNDRAPETQKWLVLAAIRGGQNIPDAVLRPLIDYMRKETLEFAERKEDRRG